LFLSDTFFDFPYIFGKTIKNKNYGFYSYLRQFFPLSGPKTTSIWSRHILFQLASMVSERRRLRRAWQVSRSRIDKTAYNRACKDLSKILLDLKRKSLKAYLADLEPCSAVHNLWNATEYLTRPTRRMTPVKSCRSMVSIKTRESQRLCRAFKRQLPAWMWAVLWAYPYQKF